MVVHTLKSTMQKKKSDVTSFMQNYVGKTATKSADINWKSAAEIWGYHLEQACQTCGPHAAQGPIFCGRTARPQV